MKLVEPKKPYKPSKPSLPSPPDEYDYMKNSFEANSNETYDLLDIFEKLSISLLTLDPKKLIFNFDYYSDYDYSESKLTVLYDEKIKVKKAQYVFDYETKQYQKALKAYDKKVKKYEEKLAKYEKDIEVYNVKKKEYDRLVKEADMAYKIEMFNKLKKELKM